MSVFTLPVSYRFRKVTVQAGKQTGRGGKGKDATAAIERKTIGLSSDMPLDPLAATNGAMIVLSIVVLRLLQRA